MQWLDFNHVVPSDVRLQTWLAFAFLAICLFNTVGLLLAKFLRRSGEIGVRRALGATRGAVFAQCLVEAGLIGLLGGIGGWLLTAARPVAGAPAAGGVRRPGASGRADVRCSPSRWPWRPACSPALLPALRASRVAPGLQLKTL